MPTHSLSDEQKQSIYRWVSELQDRICNEFESIENGEKFQQTVWDRPGGGKGQMRLIKGDIFEKAGVNVSQVFGDVSESMREVLPPFAEAKEFWACGISLVTHMRSPFVPTVHLNTRAICTENSYWIGGGADLTPTFDYELDTKEFHQAMREACEEYRIGSYEEYKMECDRYFFLKHRNEPRGVGGIFYDYLRGESFERDFAFMQSVGMQFLRSYSNIVRRRISETWTPEEKRKQLVKRGRYVEFNLVYDRGTKFGLVTGANPEAVLMSLPPEAVW